MRLTPLSPAQAGHGTLLELRKGCVDFYPFPELPYLSIPTEGLSGAMGRWTASERSLRSDSTVPPFLFPNLPTPP